MPDAVQPAIVPDAPKSTSSGWAVTTRMRVTSAGSGTGASWRAWTGPLGWRCGPIVRTSRKARRIPVDDTTMTPDRTTRRARARALVAAVATSAVLAVALPASATPSWSAPSTSARVTSGTSAAASTAVGRAAAPATPRFTTAADAPADYQGQVLCSPAPKPGTLKLAALLTRTYGRYSIGISRPCTEGGQSEHKEGRALDWMVNGKVPAQRAKAVAFLSWLLAPDSSGDTAAMARRMGVMYIGWNNRIWRSYGGGGWAELKGCLTDPRKKASSYDTYCHRNHVHVSMSWDGAAGLTSFWDGTPVPASCQGPWDSAPAQAATSVQLIPVRSVRVLDTRSGLGTGGSPCRLVAPRWPGDATSVAVPVTGVGDVPASGVAAVAVRVTTGLPNVATTVRAFATGSAAGPASTVVSAAMRESASSTSVIPVAADGTIRVSTPFGGTDVMVDVVAYAPTDTALAVDDASGGNAHAQALTTAASGVLAPGETRVLALSGAGGVPTTPITGLATVLTVWSADATAGRTVRIGSVADDGTPVLPASWTVPVSGTHTRTAPAFVATSDGRISLRSDSAAPVRFRVDVAAWYGPADDVSGRRTVLTTPALVASSSRKVGVAGPLAAGAGVAVAVPATVPMDASAVLLEVTATGTAWGSLGVGADGAAAGLPALTLRPSTPVTEIVIVPISAGRTVTLRGLGAGASLTVQAVGYLR